MCLNDLLQEEAVLFASGKGRDTDASLFLLRC